MPRPAGPQEPALHLAQQGLETPTRCPARLVVGAVVLDDGIGDAADLTGGILLVDVVEMDAGRRQVGPRHRVLVVVDGAGLDLKGWNTEIPELLVIDFSEEDFAHVRACLKALAPVEGSRPMKLAARIELAAAVMATACEHAFESAHATGTPERAEYLYDKAEELVLRRARELYAQGPQH